MFLPGPDYRLPSRNAVSWDFETAPTLGSIETTTRQKKLLAQQSLAFNVRDPTFSQLFPEYKERYEEELARKPLHEQQQQQQALSRANSNNNADNNGLELHSIMATAAGLFAVLSIFCALAMRFF